MSSSIACVRSAGSVRSICQRSSLLSFVAFPVNLLVSKCTFLRGQDRGQGAPWLCLLCPHCQGAGLWQNNIGMMQFKRKFLCRLGCLHISVVLLGVSVGKAPK